MLVVGYLQYGWDGISKYSFHGVDEATKNYETVDGMVAKSAITN